MKKLSFRVRTTLLTAGCLAVACLVMYIALLWLADVKIVQTVEMGLTSEESGAFFSQPNDEVVIGEELPEDNTTDMELYGLIAKSGLQKFQWLGAIILLLITGAGSILAWFVSGIFIAPVKKLSQKIENVDSRQLKLDVSEFSAGDELNKLADSFLQMMERIRIAFEREKRFSMAAAHELKTPLAVMQSSIDILELSEEPTADEYREAISDIETQVSRLTTLVTDLLSFSKVGKPEFIQKVEAEPLVENLLEELSLRYPEHIISKQLTTVSLYTNQALLERALYNLLDNAAKYSPQGSTIAVQLFQEGNSCVFKVADEGYGISPEAVAHIFEAFYREDPSRCRGIAGAGLGLSFVKEFADAYGGSISCTSAVHVGTEFTLILPQNPEK